MFFSFFSNVNFSSTVKAAEIYQVLLQISQESTGLPLAPMPVGNSLGAEEFPEKNTLVWEAQILNDFFPFKLFKT